MADAWGGSWGVSWGVSWGSVVAAAVVIRGDRLLGSGGRRSLQHQPHWRPTPYFDEPVEELTEEEIEAKLAAAQAHRARVQQRMEAMRAERERAERRAKVHNSNLKFDERFTTAFDTAREDGWKWDQ